MKRKQLSMAQLGMLSNALMKNLFPTTNQKRIDPNYGKAYFNRGAVKINHDRNEARNDLMKAGS
jgi:hypothetical protein